VACGLAIGIVDLVDDESISLRRCLIFTRKFHKRKKKNITSNCTVLLLLFFKKNLKLFLA